MEFTISKAGQEKTLRLGAVVVAGVSLPVEDGHIVQVPEELVEAAKQHWALEPKGGKRGRSAPVDETAGD